MKQQTLLRGDNGMSRLNPGILCIDIMDAGRRGPVLNPESEATMRYRMTENGKLQRLAQPNGARQPGAILPGGRSKRRFGKRFARHLLSAFLVLNMLLNSLSFPTLAEDLPMGLSEDAVPELENVTLGEELINLNPVSDVTLNVFAYELNGEKQVLLSSIINEANLPINLKKVEMVAVLGADMVVMPEENQEVPAEWLYIEPVKVLVDDVERDDYSISVLADFVEAGFSVYTENSMYIIKLTNMIAPAVDGAVEELENADLEPYVEEQAETGLDYAGDKEETDQGLLVYD